MGRFDDVIVRLDDLSRGAVTLESYRCAGMSGVRECADPGIECLGLSGAGGDEYANTCDRDSNVTAKINLTHGAFNGTFSYDGLGRLITQIDAAANRTDSYLTGTQAIESRGGITAANNGYVAERNIFSPVCVNAFVLRGGYSGRVHFTCDGNYNITGAVSTAGVVLQCPGHSD